MAHTSITKRRVAFDWKAILWNEILLAFLFQPDPNNPSQSNAVASPGAAAIGSLGKKLGGLKSTISNMKMPFNKQTSHTPPKPPSKDFLTSNHQPSTSEDNLNRPYEDETISRGATNNHVGVSRRRFLEKQYNFFRIFLGTDTPVLDFWWRLTWVSKPGQILCLHTSLPLCNGILRFTSGATPADLLTVRIS